MEPFEITQTWTNLTVTQQIDSMAVIYNIIRIKPCKSKTGFDNVHL